MENQNIQLVAKQESFKLTITENLEKMIRELCKVFPSTEWSGTLFYTYEGSFENNNLHLYARDFYLQDIGNDDYTEFQNDATLAGYMVENDLLDCEIGLIHSHHGMATIFTKGSLGSSTDMGTLLDEGKDANHFLSLIVNNKGTYAAAITRKVNRKIIGTAAQVYNTFNNVPVIKDGQQFETENTIIEYFMLDIEIEHPAITKSPLELRIEELKASSNSYMNRKTISNPIEVNINKTETNVKDCDFSSWLRNKESESKKEPKQLTFNFGETFEADDDTIIEVLNTEHIDPKILEKHIAQLITGNIFAGMNPSLDLDRWSKNMENVYNKRFPEDSTVIDDAFEYFADSLLEVLQIDLQEDERYEIYGSDIMNAIWALDISNALVELNIKSNRFIDYYIKTLERWTM